jgi:putative flavoprotein involved in K+ transport
MNSMSEPEHFQTIVIGAGQAGLSVGYHLSRRGLPFLILDGNARTGDSWRQRWDSLRLFTPSQYDGLAGMPFPAPAHTFPTKDEMATYLESYAAHFELPLRMGVKVDSLTRQGDGFTLSAGAQRFKADNVVVAMANYQRPRVPDFSRQLDPGIVQMHSSEYRNPSQLRQEGVLIVGAANSGAEIALEVARSHPVWLSGRDTGQVPFRVNGPAARILLRPLFRIVFHRILTTRTPIGRRMRPRFRGHGMPRIRVKTKDLSAAGVERVGRTVAVRDGKPALEDGRVLEVANVIWCTGYDPARSWIDVPLLADQGEPLHDRGLVADYPGLYFVGLTFLHAASSEMIHGVGRDAEHIAKVIATRAAKATRAAPSSFKTASRSFRGPCR